jgi:hypothetical protein
MAAPFYFPKIENSFGAAPVCDRLRKHLVFPHKSPYNAAAGVGHASHKLALFMTGGFLTWAAKPK